MKHIAARFKHQTGFLQAALRLQPTPKDLTGGIDNPAEGIGIFSRQIVQKGLPNIHHKIHIYILYILAGGFNHLEKYESQWEGLSHILWKMKNV